jgi:uncharacterized membrane protein (DUF106 family)
MQGMKLMLLVMVVSMLVASLWSSVPIIKTTVHAILNPSAGTFLNWNYSWGLVIITGVITLITTLLQKYTTDQEAIKQLKVEQKSLQEKMKDVKDNPEKMMELQKEQMELTFNKMMPLTMRPLIYTAIPFVLFLRWFSDYFTTAGNPKLFSFFSWFWAYFLFSIVFSSIFRKVLKVH